MIYVSPIIQRWIQRSKPAQIPAVFFGEQQWQSHDLSAARLKLTTHAKRLADTLSQIGISFQVVQLNRLPRFRTSFEVC